MTIQDQLAADTQARDTAQAALDAATAQLAATQARADQIAPHLSLLDQIEAHVAGVEDAVKNGVLSLVAQMRALFNQ